VVKAQSFKPEGRGFETRDPAALVPGVYSASNRNEYQKHKNNNVLGSKIRRVCRAENVSPSVSRLSRQCGILKISQPYRPPRPVTRKF
jgi:hypothetical protein